MAPIAEIASRTASPISPIVFALIGSKSELPDPAPEERAHDTFPGAVVRIILIDESMSAAPDVIAIAPDWSTRSGNEMPRPMNSDASDIS